MSLISGKIFPSLKLVGSLHARANFSTLGSFSRNSADSGKGQDSTPSTIADQQSEAGNASKGSEVSLKDSLNLLLKMDDSAEKGPASPRESGFGSNLNSKFGARFGAGAGEKRGSVMSQILSGKFGKSTPIENSESSHTLHIKASSNNTLLSLSNSNGDVLVSCSGGNAGFKKSHRSGHEAAYQAAVKLVEKCNEKRVNVRALEIKFKGLGPGREACFKALRGVTNWHISRITDVTPIPFNGCRPKKARRL